MFKLLIFCLIVLVANTLIYKRMEYNDYKNWATKPSCYSKTQKMDYETFTKTFFVCHDFIEYNKNTGRIIMNVPTDNRITTYCLYFSWRDWICVRAFLNKANKEKQEEQMMHPEVLEFMQKLCSAELKKSQEMIQNACEETKQIILRINEGDNK